MSVMAAPLTLPVKPISRENLGTSRDRRYEVISRAARTSRAGREMPGPPASVGRVERRGPAPLLMDASIEITLYDRQSLADHKQSDCSSNISALLALHIGPPLFRQVDRTFLYDHGVTDWVSEQEMVKELKLGRNTRETREDDMNAHAG